MTLLDRSKALVALRQGLLNLLAWIGILELLILVLGAALASFFIDYVFELPWVLRAALLIGLGVLYFKAVRRNHRRLKVEIAPEDLLVTIEHKHPELEGQLHNAIELARQMRKSGQDARPAGELEALLLDRALAESTKALRHIPIEKSLDVRPLWRRAGAAAGLAFGLLLVAVLAPEAFGIWGLRNLLLSTTPWPRSTHFAFERQDGTWHHPRKEPLPIDAWVIGEVPRSVELHLRSQSVSGVVPLLPGMPARRAFTLASVEPAGGPGEGDAVEGRRLLHVIPALDAALSFHLEGGDNSSRVIDVEVHDRPKVELTRVRLVHPPHTGVAERVIENPAAEIAAIRGSRAVIEVLSDQTVREAWSRFGDEGRQAVAEILDRGFSTAIDLRDSGYLEIGFRGGDWGFEARPLRVALAVYPDALPRISLAVEGEGRSITPQGSIAYRIDAEDDFGFSRIELKLSLLVAAGSADADRGQTLDLAPWEAKRREKEQRFDVHIERRLDLAPLQLEPGMQLTIEASAADNDAPAGFKTASSGPITYLVVSPEELVEALDRERTAVRAKLEELAHVERSLIERLAASEAAAPPEAGSRDDGARPDAERAPASAESSPSSSRSSQSSARNAASSPRSASRSSPRSSAAPSENDPDSEAQPPEGAEDAPPPEDPNTAAEPGSQEDTKRAEASASSSRRPSGSQSQRSASRSAETQSTDEQSSSENAPENASESASEASPEGEQQASEPQSSRPQAAPGESPSRAPSSSPRRSPSAAERQPSSNDIARRQSDAAREAQELRRRLDDISRALDANRLQSDAERRRFEEEVARPLEALSEEEIPRSARDLEALPRTGAEDRAEERQRAEAKIDDIARQLQDIAKRLESTRQFREILNRLQLIIELQGKVIEETTKEAGK
jgi:hypothetical protein